jgi:oligopeptide/dipeptide ABC transporter ATP-binding protein
VSGPKKAGALPSATEILLEARGLKKYFAIRGGIAGRTVGFVRAVDGVDLQIPRGKTLGLIGESGCGKTTVGRCLLHLLEPTEGSVIFRGQDLEVARPPRLTTAASAAFGLAAVANTLMLLFPVKPTGLSLAISNLPSWVWLLSLAGIAGAIVGAEACSSRRQVWRAIAGAAILVAAGNWVLGGAALALVALARQDFGEDTARSARKEMQIVFQDPFGSLNPRMLVSRIVSEGLRAFRHELADRYPEEAAQGGGKLTEEAMERIVANLMARVGLNPEHLNRFPHEFSGGQRQRICVARALALKPSFIVLDEPTSALDVSVQAQILNLLKELQRERDLTYLFISHHLAVIRHMCDDVAVMYLGRIVEQASNEALFSAPAHPYTIALLSAIPSVDPETRRERIVLEGEIPSPANPPSGCRFHTRCMFGLERDVVEGPVHATDAGGKVLELLDPLVAPNTVRLVVGGKEVDPLAAEGAVAYEVDEVGDRGAEITLHVEVPPGAAIFARYRRYRAPCALESPALRDVAPGHQVSCHFAEEVNEARGRAARDSQPIGAVIAKMRAPVGAARAPVS